MANSKNKIKTDWLLLIFLLLFTNQAILSLKLFGLCFIYLLRPNFKFGLKEGRMPMFSIYILILSTVNLLFFIRDFSSEYLAAFTVGNLFWVFAFLAFHQIKLSAERYGPDSLYNVMKAFVVINLAACIWQLVAIMRITGKLNPYEGLEFPYGMSTGDNIWGIFLQNSYYNMMVSAMLSLYFIYKRDLSFAILSFIGLVLVFGNYGSLVFNVVLIIMLGIVVLNILINSGRVRWLFLSRIVPPGNAMIYIPFLFVLFWFLYATISPSNTSYVVEKLKSKVYSINPDNKNDMRSLMSDQKFDVRVLSMDGEIYERLRRKEIDTEKRLSFSDAQNLSVTKNEDVKVNVRRGMTRLYVERLQGKVLSLLETWQFLKTSPPHFLLGAGTTRFSSLTAQKMAGYDSSRLFMNILPHYISPYYKENHLLILEERRKGDKAYLSNANWPDSFINQLLGEYGVIGAMLFVFFYLGYFYKTIRYGSYAPWLVILVLSFVHLTYLFEPLSVLVFFELLLIAREAELKKQYE